MLVCTVLALGGLSATPGSAAAAPLRSAVPTPPEAPILTSGQLIAAAKSASQPANGPARVSGYSQAATPSTTRQPLTSTPATAAASHAGAFVGVSPARVLDTRPGYSTNDGLSAGVGSIGSYRSIPVTIGGRAGVASNAQAVVVNLTVTNATAATFVTLYGVGGTLPATSNVNVVPGQTVAVQATIALGTNGAVNVYNAAGQTDVIIDVVGYYTGASDTNAQSAFYAQPPSRLVDTRQFGRLPAFNYFAVDLTVADTTAVALNITVTGPDTGGYLTVWPGATDNPPQTSALNFGAHQTLANMAVTPTSIDPQTGDPSFSVGNFSAGDTDVIVDVVGFYVPLSEGGGSLFVPTAPTRLVDTRSSTGLPHPLAPSSSGYVTTSGAFGDAGTVGLVANATALDDTVTTFLTVYPGDESLPETSSLNLAPNEIHSNMIMTGVSAGANRTFAEFNASGSMDTLIDVVGYFEESGQPASVALSSSVASSTFDSAVTLTATVNGPTSTPTGKIAFADANGSILAVEPLVGGVAQLVTSALAPGSRTIVAGYSGDNSYAPAQTTGPTITVAAPTATIATAFQNDSRHDGMDLADTFDPATLHQAWSIDLNPTSGTAVVSYPLIVGARIFVTVANSQGRGRRRLRARLQHGRRRLVRADLQHLRLDQPDLRRGPGVRPEQRWQTDRLRCRDRAYELGRGARPVQLQRTTHRVGRRALREWRGFGRHAVRDQRSDRSRRLVGRCRER